MDEDRLVLLDCLKLRDAAKAQGITNPGTLAEKLRINYSLAQVIWVNDVLHFPLELLRAVPLQLKVPVREVLTEEPPQVEWMRDVSRSLREILAKTRSLGYYGS